MPAVEAFDDRSVSRAEILAQPITVSRFAAVATPVFFAVAVSLAWYAFAPIVPPQVMRPWVGLAVVFQLFWFVAAIVLLWRNPDRAELVRVWAPITRIVAVVSNVIVIWTIWMFLPHASTTLRVVMAAFYVGQIATQVAYSPENAPVVRIGIVTIAGSAAWVLISGGEALEQLVAVFLIAFAVAMFIVADVQRQVMRAAIQARFDSEDAEAETARALASVAAERDAKTQFIAAASHDLGQPLQAAALFFDQVMRAPDASQRAAAADGVTKAFRAAEQQLSHMLNHLRLEADAVEPILSRVPLSLVLRRLAGQFQPQAAAAGLRLDVVASSATVRVDPALLDRALGNLVGNAIRHSGGSRILVGVLHRGARLRIWVIDDGRGIDPDDAAHVFDDYYRAVGPRVAGQGGFGLGLASVRRIAGLLGGVAGLDPAWRGGAAFFIELAQLRSDMEA